MVRTSEWYEPSGVDHFLDFLWENGGNLQHAA